jgi:hypothetical protein
MLSAASLLAVNAALAQEKQPDENLSAWLGQEFTVNASSRNEYMPDRGKLTFTYDAGKDAVHVCARNADDQEGSWKMDLSKPCGVTMAFTRGTKYCTAEDVKAGNAEVLATCHRLRSRDVALRPSQTKGAVELNDMVAFLLQETDGTKSMAILVDSPSRPTDGTVIIVRTRR